MKTIKTQHTETHTPTPWHRNVSPAYKYPIYADENGDPKGRNWIHIAAVLSGNPNAEADLDFIVKAVNAHDPMVTLLEKVSRSACLDQRLGDKCICFSCEANRILANI